MFALQRNIIIKDSPNYNIFACEQFIQTIDVLDNPMPRRNYLKEFLPNFDIVGFDFQGSGLSGGQYTTLGFQEKEDLQCVIQYLQDNYQVKEIILWGRSMGAVTSILYASKYNQSKIVKAMVLDSAFSNLEKLLSELAYSYIPFLPQFILKSLMESIQQKITEKLSKNRSKTDDDFSLYKISPITSIKDIKIPMFFIAGKDDKLVNCNHTQMLYNQVKTTKQLELLEGGHNDLRPKHLKITILEFLLARVSKGYNKYIKRVQIHLDKRQEKDKKIQVKKEENQRLKEVVQEKQKIQKQIQQIITQRNIKNQQYKAKDSQRIVYRKRSQTQRRNKIFSNNRHSLRLDQPNLNQNLQHKFTSDCKIQYNRKKIFPNLFYP